MTVNPLDRLVKLCRMDGKPCARRGTEMTLQATATIQIDNDRVRVTEWHFLPGAETGFHIHEMDYVVVPSGNGRLKIVDSGGRETFVDLKHGVSYFRNAGVHHNVINANDCEFAFVEIELKT
jgi:beta-alanine degradation protein BauB